MTADLASGILSFKARDEKQALMISNRQVDLGA
jgi:hypothetical protein